MFQLQIIVYVLNVPPCSPCTPGPGDVCEEPALSLCLQGPCRLKESQVKAANYCDAEPEATGVEGRGGARCLPQKHLQCLCS